MSNGSPQVTIKFQQQSYKKQKQLNKGENVMFHKNQNFVTSYHFIEDFEHKNMVPKLQLTI